MITVLELAALLSAVIGVLGGALLIDREPRGSGWCTLGWVCVVVATTALVSQVVGASS